MGAQFDATITAVLGVGVALLYAFAALGSSSAYNKRHPDTYIDDPVGMAFNALFLFVGVFAAQMLRQIYPKLYFFSLKFMMVQMFSLTAGTKYINLPYNIPLNYGIPMAIGAGLSLVVNLIIWPETAVDGLGRALKETITGSREMLHMITKQFFLDPEAEMVSSEIVDAAAAKMRVGMTKVKTAYREAKYEISYSYIRPQELVGIRRSMDSLTKHLNILGSCLKSERQLFETALENLDQGVTESESEDEYWTIHSMPTQQGKGDSSKRRSRCDLEATLRKAATFAANDYAQSGRYHSPKSSRQNSRANSRRTSIDEDYTEQNQRSVNSMRSFMSSAKIASPKGQLPRKTKKKDKSNRHVLVSYLESLRDPLMLLSVECAEVLDCISDSIAIELDMEDDSDKSIRETWYSYLRHVFKIRSQEQIIANTKASQRRHASEPCNCAQSLHEAIGEFDKAERQRMDMLYGYYKKQLDGPDMPLGVREELSLVFFFIFTLREAANKLEYMALEMDVLRKNSQERMRNGKKRKHLYMPQLNQKWWHKWASWSNHQSTRDKGGEAFGNLTYHMPKSQKKVDAEDEYRLTKIQTHTSFKRTVLRRESVLIKIGSHNSSNKSAITESPTTLRKRFFRNPHPSISTDRESERTDIDEPESKGLEHDVEANEKENADEKPPFGLRVRYRVWRTVQYMERYEFKFGLKMALAVSLLCVPAFVPASTGCGGTLQAGAWRVVGTVTGAMVGWAALEAGGTSPYLLAFFAVILAIPFFYIHLASGYNKVGVVVLISYTVVALSRYSNPNPNETIAETVWMVWPFIARHATRKSIAAVISELGDYYSYLMGTFFYHDPMFPPTEDDIKFGQKMERNIQSSIDSCSTLLELTDHEPRFKGPFPKEFYQEMIISTRNLLDRMMSIRVALEKMPQSVKRDLCSKEYYTYRRDLMSSMILHFYTLSSSLRSKIPLPVYMPFTRSSRAKLNRKEQEGHTGERWVKLSNLTWFATACATEESIEELEYLSNLIKFIVGENKYADRARRIDSLMGEDSLAT
ncbi:hypothetical protein J3Q64DRAFT_1809690 [Phycomyces blakesleeanus]|uniref:ER transporter 6TM N-terminal domain-containing protein n=1 Tax=Phycomyces blakesleeanus TaxID=4837 RepID=A0ABR3B079_PHYBL